MRGDRNRCAAALLSGVLLCTVGCAGDPQAQQSESAQITDLPPLVTTASETQAATEDSLAETTTTPVADPLYEAEWETWDLPEELGALQAVRTLVDTVYLLGIQENGEGQRVGCLYQVLAEPEPTFSPLFPGADAADFVGLTDFDVLSDGTVCGLICENTNAIPYEDPTFDPDTYDWDTYYENYATQYRLVWYNQSGYVTQSLWLSTLLELDQSSRQTLAFTGVRCDTSDQIYLTATIDDQEYLMALDGKENLCMIQGSSSKLLTLSPGYQWLRCGEKGMLLLEQGEEAGDMALYHVTVTDDAMWKTQVTTPTQLTDVAIAAEDIRPEGWLSFWDDTGLYQAAKHTADAELLYTWSDLGLDVADVAGGLVLAEGKVLVMSYTARGDLALQLVVPEGYETPTQPETTPPSYDNTPTSPPAAVEPPVATPLTTLSPEESKSETTPVS